jgi:signal transduction histidine kinase
MITRLGQSLILSIGTLVLVLWMVAGGLLLYLGSTMRASLREQIISRDAYLLSALADLEMPETLEETEFLEDRWLAYVDRATELKGIVAVRLTDLETGYTESVPEGILAAPLLPTQQVQLETEGFFASYTSNQILDLLFESVTSDEIGVHLPVLDLTLPVRSENGNTLALLRFWIDGTSMAKEFSELDDKLWRQGVFIWLSVGVASLLGGTLAYVVIRRLYRSLEARTQELERSNRELELAVRSSAVGAITGNLMHGLKNPLAGLRSYLRATNDEEAQRAAERMQMIVNETLAALRSEERSSVAEVTAAELRQLVIKEWDTAAQARGVDIVFGPWEPRAVFSGRELNLIVLVINNLIQNALEASGRGSKISLALEGAGQGLCLRVSDEGSGVSRDLKAKLFTPLTSSKSGGSGLGLAISRQMARSWGGDLQLVENGGPGAVFEVLLPLGSKDKIGMR